MNIWIWSWGPDSYLDGASEAPPELVPGGLVRSSCSRATTVGDLSLLYRTSPAKDFAYLLQVISLPEADGDFGGARATYLCDAEVIEVFEPTLPFSDVWSDPVLKDESFVRRKMRVSNPSISEQAFLRIVELLEVAGNHGLGVRIPERVDDRLLTFESELALESWVYENPDRLGVWLGLDGLEPDDVRGTAGPGRQVTLRDGSRVDLMLSNGKCRLVIEVKAGAADAASVGQVAAYQAQVQKEDHVGDRAIRAVVVSGATPRPGAGDIANLLGVAILSAPQLQSAPPPVQEVPAVVGDLIDVLDADRSGLGVAQVIFDQAEFSARQGEMELASQLRHVAFKAAGGEPNDALVEMAALLGSNEEAPA